MDLQEDIKQTIRRVLNESKFDTINYSDLPNTWDNISRSIEGKFMYVPKNGLYVKVDKVPEKRFRPMWHQDHLADKVEWMRPEVAEKKNELLKRARDLELEAKRLRQMAKGIEE